MIKVVINEQHNLFDEQKQILDQLGEWQRLDVPANGWTAKEQDKIAYALANEVWNQKLDLIVLASPIPYLSKVLYINLDDDAVLVFHNDKREKLELPNGKIIMKVAKEGWQLL